MFGELVYIKIPSGKIKEEENCYRLKRNIRVTFIKCNREHWLVPDINESNIKIIMGQLRKFEY